MSYESPTVVKASFNFPKDELNGLKELAARRSIPVTQALRQAVASEQFLQQLVDDGKKILVQDSDGNRQEIVFSQTQNTRTAVADSQTENTRTAAAVA